MRKIIGWFEMLCNDYVETWGFQKILIPISIVSLLIHWLLGLEIESQTSIILRHVMAAPIYAILVLLCGGITFGIAWWIIHLLHNQNRIIPFEYEERYHEYTEMKAFALIVIFISLSTNIAFILYYLYG